MRYSFACLLVISPLLALGEEPSWPRWRGPLGNGYVADVNPPLKWDESTNIKWKVRLPGERGSSTPVVVGDRLFVQATEDTGKRAKPEDIPKPNRDFQKIPEAPKTYHRYFLLCLDLNSGKEKWRKLVAEAVPHEGHHPNHSHAGYSPVTDGERVYATFGSRGVFCFTLEGEPVWERDFPRMETRRGWGEGGSMALHDGVLVLPYDHEGPSFIAGLDAKTGKTLWKQDRDEVTCWSTPLVIEQGGKAQVIVNGTGYSRAYDLKSGEVIWKCAGQTVNAIPSPVATDKAVICMSGYRGAYAVAIPRGATGDVTKSEKLIWTHDRGTPYVPSPMLMDGRLYFSQGNNATLSCLDAETGEVIFDRERVPGVRSFYASPVGAKGRIYLTGRGGTTVVLKAGTSEVDVLATNPLDDEIDGTPVLVGGKVLLRGQRYLYCVEGK